MAPTVGIWLDEPIKAESSTTLVPASSACSMQLTFYCQSKDEED
jgi:hypothetical protein